jgi:GNAT superfamily N-acetyltransferase
MPCPSIVRVAKPADHMEIWRLFLQGHKENGKFSVAHEKVDWFIWRALNPDAIPEWDTAPRCVLGVIGPIGQLEGLVFVSIGSFWYTNERHLEEYIVYVDPECRQSGHARALIDWMKQQSDKNALPLITGIISDHRTEAKVRLYRRMLQPVGAFFSHGMKGASSVSSAAFA